MGDRETSFTVRFDGESVSLSQVFANIVSQARSAARDIEQTTGRIDAFRGLQEKVAATAKSLFDARDRAAEFRRQIAEIESVGGKVGTELVNSLKATEAQIKATSREYGRQADLLAKMDEQLRKAGVDTTNLAASQAKLAESLKQANAAAAQQSAKDILGLKTLGDIQPKIMELEAAFNTLRTSGKLSASEIATAQGLLNQRIRETRDSIIAAGASGALSGDSLASFFTKSLLPAAGLTLSIGGVVSALHSAVEASRSFQEQLARIATISTLSDEQIRVLGDRVRALARTLNIDADQALKTFFDLLREGIGEEQAFTALQASAEAAKGSLSDIADVAKVGADLMSAYGISANELRGVFDKLFAAAKNDGPTFKELAPSIGSLAVVAKSVGVPIDELIALLNVMTSASGDASGSVSALQRILVQWNTDEVRRRLRDLNIQATDFSGVMRELAERGIPVTKLVDLGVASSRSAAGVAALTANAKALDDALARTASAAGTTQQAIDRLRTNSPSEKIRALSIEVSDLGRNFTNLFGTGDFFAEWAATIINPLNQSGAAIRNAIAEGKRLGSTWQTVASALFASNPLLDEANRLLAQTAPVVDSANAALAAIDAQIAQLLGKFSGLATDLTAGIQALQKAASDQIASVQSVADAEIAALDRSAAATAATAARTLEIQLAAAAKRLVILTENEAAVTAATEKAVAARILALQAENLSAEKIAKDTNRIRLEAIGPILAQYQDLYNKLVAQAQDYSAKVQTIDQSRLAFNQNLEKQLFDIRIAALSAFDQYLAKVTETEKLIAKVREAGAKGDVASAEKFAQEAIALSNQLQTVVKSDGTVIVSQFQAQQQKLDLVRKAGEELNKVYDAQGDAAQRGANQTLEQLDATRAKLTELRGIVDGLSQRVAEGLRLKVETDGNSFTAAEQQLAELSRDRTVTITVRTVTPDGQPTPPPAPTQGFAAGGPVRSRRVRLWQSSDRLGRAVQRFAHGGPVFRLPNWNKVPGSGNRDTVPAGLQAGSYVVRKQASRHYGDELMSRIVKGFVAGGNVLRGGDIAKLLLGQRGSGSFGGASLGSGNAGLGEYADLLSKLQRLIEADRLLPDAGPGAMSIGEWAGRVINRWPFFDDRRKKQIIGVMENFEGWLATIENARAFGVPAVVENSIAALAFRRGGAAGPAGPDTVPALLTPGEWVVKPTAVQKYGEGFLAALNAMRIPRASLEHLINPPAPRIHRFADGGMVGSPRIFQAPERGRGSGSGTTINNTFRIDGDSVLTEENIRRKIIPVLEKIGRRSR